LGEICSPAPTSRSASACSARTTRQPFCAREIAAAMPPIPAPMTIALRIV